MRVEILAPHGKSVIPFYRRNEARLSILTTYGYSSWKMVYGT